MKIAVVPGRRLLAVSGSALAAALVALIAGAPVDTVWRLTMAALATLAVLTALDYVWSRRAWRAAAVTMARRLPAAFAIGVKRPVDLVFGNQSGREWRLTLHDGADPSLQTEGLPVAVTIPAGKEVDVSYVATPTRRGEVVFSPAELRIASRLRLCELLETIGSRELRRVYPDFAQIARYAWLAGDRRLQEIGIKTYQRRGEGTDFKQLSEYRVGDSVRHIDWRATLRLEKPIVREYQDERDQCVMLLVDCGRRMRADDRQARIGTTHFDQVLNAVMLLTYVALQQGDAVGAMTFGTPAGEERSYAPRKGTVALNGLMGQIYGLQPTPTHSDYVAAAENLLRRQHRRALVVVITNFRDEDTTELHQALRLLRSRHLVLLASLRERIVGELMSLPLESGEAAIDVASAHLYEQSRRDAFVRLSGRDALMVDAEPERLGIELVNRYHAVKRAGMI